MIMRAAEEYDLPQLAELMREEFAYQKAIAPLWDIDAGLDFGRLVLSAIRSPAERLIVAEDEARLIGYIHVRTTDMPAARSRRFLPRRKNAPASVRLRISGWIEDCYVATRCRRRGVGSALLHEGLAWLASRNAVNVGLAVSQSNEDGRRFWEHCGFSAYRIQMYRPAAGD
jgi:ribosomal protein S18 acetylase RimI-like enzyme